MMKKRWIVLSMVLSLGLMVSGCANAPAAQGNANVAAAPTQAQEEAVVSQTETEVETEVEAQAQETPVTREFRFDTQRDMDQATVQASLTGYDEDGNVTWTFTSDWYPETELDVVQDIGLNVNGYYLLLGGSLYCIVPSGEEGGTVEWVNDEFGGASASWCYGDSGEIYLTGYYGPHLMSIDGAGHTIARYDYFEDCDEFYWPYNVSYDSESQNVYVTFYSTDETLCVNPANGEVVSRMKLDPGRSLVSTFVNWTTADMWNFLNAQWAYTPKGSEAPCVYIYVDALNGTYLALRSYDDNQQMAEYGGLLEANHLYNTEDELPDLLVFSLETYTDSDDIMTNYNSIGDYSISDVYINEDDEVVMKLFQMNNGDTLFSLYYDDFEPELVRWPLDGAFVDGPGEDEF